MIGQSGTGRIELMVVADKIEVCTEMKLLIYMMRSYFSSKPIEQVPCFKEEIDWDLFIYYATVHKVVPIIYLTLKNDSSFVIPETIYHRLKSLYISNQKKNLIYSATLLRILALLSENNILAIPYKGPILADSVYEDMSVRTFSDLDLFVERKDIINAKNLLLSNGFILRSKIPNDYESRYLDIHIHYELIHIADNIAIDLHWALSRHHYSSAIIPERLIKNLKQRFFLGKKVTQFSNEDMLFIACEHGARHGWNCMQFICDIAQLTKCFTHDEWDRIIKKGNDLYMGRMILFALFLAKDIMKIRIPEKVEKSIQKNPIFLKLANTIYKKIFFIDYGGTSFFENPIFHFHLKERLSDKIRYCVKSMFIPAAEDWDALTLPRPLYYLYYLTRPFRLARKHAKTR